MFNFNFQGKNHSLDQCLIFYFIICARKFQYYGMQMYTFIKIFKYINSNTTPRTGTCAIKINSLKSFERFFFLIFLNIMLFLVQHNTIPHVGIDITLHQFILFFLERERFFWFTWKSHHCSILIL